jgi:glycosyltransferase involved in cell wall biosynthesis
MPYFSIIIPTYNRAAILPRAMESVINQTFDDWELIIVDDGSSDDTKQVVESIHDDRISYVFQENKGVCAARNNGASIAKGDYLCFLDSDDYVKAEWLQDFFDTLEIKKADIAACKMRITDNSKTETQSFLAGNFCIDRIFFNSVGQYDEKLRYGENTDLKWRINSHKFSIITIDKVNVVYDTSSKGASGNKENQVAFFYHVLHKHQKMFQSDKRLAQIHYQKAGVNCVKIGRKKQGLKLIWRGYFQNPLHLKSLGRSLLYTFKL